MIFIYRCISLILYPLFILLIFFRKLINKEDVIRYKEKIFPSYFSVDKKKNCDLIWFHAASIGEVQSIFPIIDELNHEKREREFLITTVTLSSGKLIQEKIKKYKNIKHRYFPIDVNFLSKIFISLWKPKAIFFIDSEIWPNLILNILDKKIPTAIINARITKKTFKRWMIIPNTARKIFSSFNFSLSSSYETKEFLNKLGAKNIFFYGNIKFSSAINLEKIENRDKKILQSKNFWCAASTHKEEEEFCLKTHFKLKQNSNNILTVIAPRHLGRSREIKKLCIKYNLSSQILNIGDKILDNSEIVIVNSFGVLQDYFKYARSVFIGKSMIKRLEREGGQNPILAAKLGCKIYHGPYVYNFDEVYTFLKTHKISEKVLSSEELADHLIEDFKKEEKKKFKQKKVIDVLGEKILENTANKISNFLTYET